ncbi:hypothetical protein V5O48_000374 [Marasmius crinis-equi]|uniref:AB hydrolase-1 domain-containing protein n=1 Tax=Marasmius crinis-equi TaxID=585013 RepID=A0ABR3G1Q6_9AGAR
MTMTKELSRAGTTVETNMLARGSVNRRDIWPSKEEAYRLFKSRGAWKVWDDRVLRIFVEYGLRSLPSLEYPDQNEGVTLKCTRKQETASLPNLAHSSNFRTFAERVPIHLVYGTAEGFPTEEIKEDVVNNAIGGEQNLASYQRIPNAGHLAPQTHPTGVAQAIYKALTGQASSKSAKL